MAKRRKIEAEKVPQLPCPPDAALNVGVAMECKPAPPSKAERRARLIAAHVALENVRFEFRGAWEHQEGVSREILAAIGRMEVTD